MRTFARTEFSIVPGTKKKEELKAEIVAVYLGEKTPEKPRKSGRPTLNSKVVEKEVDDIKQPEVEFYTNHEETLQEEEDDYTVEGILDVRPEGYGFLRLNNFSASTNGDVYVPPQQIRRFSLRSGDKLEARVRRFKEKSAPSLIFVFKINDISCDQLPQRISFDKCKPTFPNQRIVLETTKNEYALRAVDLVAPLGKGSRGLIVAPPKVGKTILLKKIAQAVKVNHPEIHLTVLLVGERPEEVTDFVESVDCEVVYSTFDQTPTHHQQIAEMVVKNAIRRVELGQDVMILMDSITRLARAYNQTMSATGRTLTGGLDISALQMPKKLFGSGRKIASGGSLTILATALVDTGSKMDDIIYEEFKGTGNMEIHLDRRLSEKRIFPAIDLAKSGTRREDLLLTQAQVEGMYLIRRALSNQDEKATEELLDMLTCTSNNQEFIETLKLLTKRRLK
ncbi:MAG: transcription termination factor Rho [Clostridia bacterium]|nr:transcription termination factor Rho [Clostridia bacterium]